MPVYRGHYPATKYPIQFGFEEDLVNDPGCNIGDYRSLERPRQLSLNIEDETEFKTLPRDYCILESPGFTSWSQLESQRNLRIRIFHSDVVRIPTDDPLPRFQKEVYNTSYMARWYLQGMTRVNVEILLRTHFGLSIPLSSESTADHWVPAFKVCNVEVAENVWEDRLALFFDGFVGTSAQAMNHRRDRRQILRNDCFGTLFYHCWRLKWDLKAPQNKASTSNYQEPLIPNTVEDSMNEEVSNELQSNSNVRGRKRRAVLRQLRTNASLVSQRGTDDSAVQYHPTSTLNISTPVRGRIRRRELRKIKSEKENLQTVPPEDVPHLQRLVNQHPENSTSRSHDLNSGIAWRFENGDAAPAHSSHKSPLTLTIGLGKTNLHNEDHVHGEFSRTMNFPGFNPRRDVPILTIRSLATPTSSTLLHTRFHLISYCNIDSQISKIKRLSLANFDIKNIESENEDQLSDIEDHEIHVADLIDDVGVVKSIHSDAFFSVIEVEKSMICQDMESSFGYGAAPVPREERDIYWQKFSGLLSGFHLGDDVRHLPYSCGYGVDHINPALIRKQNTWGYFDVDNVCSRSRRPRWRAAWKFEMVGKSEKCGCAFKNVTHDLNTCRYLFKEEPSVSHDMWRKAPFQDKVILNLIGLIHKPYETLQSFEKQHLNVLSSSSDEFSTEESHSPTKSDAAEDNKITEHEAKRVAEEQARKLEDANRYFEIGLRTIIGLGVSKDIQRGTHLVAVAARLGNTKARAMGPRIARAYHLNFDVPDELVGQWLCEEALYGSRIAMKELQLRFPDRYRDVLSANNFVINPEGPRVLNYTEDILPHFDLSNVTLLDTQMKFFVSCGQTDLQSTAASSPRKNLSVMGIVREKSRYKPVKYFVFGSLLHIACLFGFLEATVYLLDIGFDIDGQNGYEALRTPLLCALNRGHYEIAKLLISRGTDCRPLMLWSEEKIYCTTPTPLHYLVNIEDDGQAEELARLLVKAGADVNYKCSSHTLQNQSPTETPVLKGKSVTPLRWAVLHQKSQLVKTLLRLGAKFAYEEYLKPSMPGNADFSTKSKGCLLLETPCTDLDILELFFARAKVPGISVEFSQTPLGLLVSEEDGPERRLRPGFADFDAVRAALDLLLELQPGWEEELLWSSVRHDHIEIVRYLLEDLNWSIETKWRGLTCLHTAVLYGRTDIVRYLINQGANTTALTKNRKLTCFHLLMLVPQDPKTDRDIMEALMGHGINVDAKEAVDGLTALQIAVRNRKLHSIKTLLSLGADLSLPVKDQLLTIAQGTTGLVGRHPNPPQTFTENLTLLGEVLVQYIQDRFYDFDYVADLLLLFLENENTLLPPESLVVDKGNGISVLHLLSMIPEPDDDTKPKHSPYGLDPLLEPPLLHTAKISLLQMILARSDLLSVNFRDKQGDTPLHYACCAHNFGHIQALLASGADPSIRNKVGLAPVDVLAWSVFFIGGKTLGFDPGEKSWHTEIDYVSGPKLPGFGGSRQKRGSHPATNFTRCFAILASVGHTVDRNLQRLVVAWDYATSGRHSKIPRTKNSIERRHLEIVEEHIARMPQEDKDPDSRYKANGKYDFNWDLRVRRPYMLGSVMRPMGRSLMNILSESEKNTEEFERMGW